MPTIQELLRRRTDFSTFLVHLTRDTDDGVTARDHLLSILTERTLRRGATMGEACKWLDPDSQPEAFIDSQRVVCFTETPLEHTWMMCQQIEHRQTQFQPYGLAFTKTWARLRGVNPVWYVDITPTGRDWLMNAVDHIVAGAISANDFGHDIFRITPFIEAMGRMGKRSGRRPKEFWWEREWRYAAADLDFDTAGLVAVLAPSDQHGPLQEDLAGQEGPGSEDFRYLDPNWSLERMIAALAGVREDLTAPFPRFPPPTLSSARSRRRHRAAVKL